MRKTLLLLFCFQSLIISSQILDPTFGTNGIANNQLTNFTSTDICHKAAIQSDDKLVYVGQSDIGYYIARTNVNGTLDTSFNDIGYKLTDRVNSIAILSNGQIMYGAGTGIFLLNSDGSPDTTFGNQGWVRLDYNSNYIYIVSIKIQNDGKILVLGSCLEDFCTIRLNPNGTYDTTFDADGKAILSVGVSKDEPSEIEIQTDGKIIITGRSLNYDANPDTNEIVTFRYLSNGTLDTAFAVNGISKIDFGSGSMDLPQDIKIQPDGKIVLLCHTQYYKITLLRFNSNGTYDTTFDLDGILNTNYTDYQTQSAKPKLIIKPNGKILCSFSRSKIFNLMQINSDGSPDNTFGVNSLSSYNNGELCTSKYLFINSLGTIVTGGRSLLTITSTNYFTKTTNVSFNTNGIFQNSTSFNVFSSYDDIKNICELSTGKTIALTLSKNSNTLNTSPSLVRFNSDGSIDTTYGSNGLIPLSIKFEEIKKCSNDKVILNAFSSLHKLNEDGTYDTSFGTNGIVDFSSSNGSIGRSFRAIEVTDNDQIYALLMNVDYSIGEGLFSMELLRLNANGSIDTTFGTNGYALYRFNSNGIDNSESPYCLSILSNGQIIVAGTVFSSPVYVNYLDFGIGFLKYNTNGTLDTTFGTNGKVLSNFNNVYTPKQIVCTSNNEIIINVLGEINATIKYNNNGSLDSSYGINGVVEDLFQNNDMIIQPDNKILKTGQLNNDITTVRYNTNGTLDTTFGNQGYLTSVINQNSSPNDFLLLSNGSLLIAGNSSNTAIYASQARYTDLNFVTNNNTQSNKTVFYPNPIRNIANFDFLLEKDGIISIEIVDLQGRVVQNIVKEKFTKKGKYSKIVTMESDIAAGNYFIRLSTPLKNQSLKIIKID